jgi:tetratricopeptide (TPR) repeat protein
MTPTPHPRSLRYTLEKVTSLLRYAEAAREFQAALTLEPRLVRVRYQLAVCHFNMRKLKPARDEFARVGRESGGDPSATYYLGRVDLLEGRIESAIRELKSIVSAPRPSSQKAPHDPRPVWLAIPSLYKRVIATPHRFNRYTRRVL